MRSVPPAIRRLSPRGPLVAALFFGTFGISDATAADNRPIGVFDSGTGGLTVLEKMLTIDRFNNVTGEERADGIPDFAGERFAYFGDQANMPYGDYAGAGKSEFLRGLVLNDAAFLLGDRYACDAADKALSGRKEGVKTLVIACNTATAYGFDAVSQMLAARGDGTQVTGVVNAGAKAALDALGLVSGSQAAPCAIGVMATPGTIASGVYARTIRRELAARGVTSRVEIYARGCAGLADAVEAGAPNAAQIACDNLKAVQDAAAKHPEAPLKAVILGCTHFPFVQDSLERHAPGVLFVDPAVYTAAECFRALHASRRRAVSATGAMPVETYISVASAEVPAARRDASGGLSRAYKYGRDDAAHDTATRPVPIKVATNGDPITFIPFAKRIPAVAARLAPVHIRAIAHRGLHGAGVAQNSVASFAAAWAGGAKWIETDFHLLKNGRILCVHDTKELTRMSGEDRVIADLTEADVASINIGKQAQTAEPVHMPYLAEVLATVPKDAIAQCEIKLYGPGYAEKFDAAVKAAGLSETNILVTSFQIGAVRDFKKQFPKYETLLLVGRQKDGELTADRLIDMARRAQVKYVCPGAAVANGLTPADADKIRAAGFGFRFYGVNSPDALAKAVQLGVTAFTTDHWREAFVWAQSIPGLVLTP